MAAFRHRPLKREARGLAPLRFSLAALRAAWWDLLLATLFIIVWVAADRLPFDPVSSVVLAFQFEAVVLLTLLVAAVLAWVIIVVGGFLHVLVVRDQDDGEVTVSGFVRRAPVFTALSVLALIVGLLLYLAWFLEDSPSFSTDWVFLITLLAVTLSRAWQLVERPRPVLIYLFMYAVTVLLVLPILGELSLPAAGITPEVAAALKETSFVHGWALMQFNLMPGGFMAAGTLFYGGAAFLTVLTHGASDRQVEETVLVAVGFAVATAYLARVGTCIVTGEWYFIGTIMWLFGLLIYLALLAGLWLTASDKSPEECRTAVVILIFQVLVVGAACILTAPEACEGMMESLQD